MRIGAPEQVDASARTEHRRQQRLRVAQRAGWPELERRHLLIGKHGIVTDERDGASYRINRGELDAQYSPIAAYYIDQHGNVVALEKTAKR